MKHVIFNLEQIELSKNKQNKNAMKDTHTYTQNYKMKTNQSNINHKLQSA